MRLRHNQDSIPMRLIRSRYVLVMSFSIVGNMAQVGVSRAQTSLNLDEAIELAFSNSPVLLAREAEVGEAHGRVRAAETYPFNPELGVAAARRRGGDASTTDYGVAVAQEIEIGGQRGKRTRTARAELAATEAAFAREQRLLAAAVALAFSEAVRSRDILEIERTDAELARQFASLMQRRFDAGAASLVERNLGEAAIGRAEHRAQKAQAAFRQAQALLAEAVGLDPAQAVEPVGDPPVPISELRPLEDLLGSAMEHRADLEELRRIVEAAKARRQLARAEAIPNLGLEGFYEKEEGTDTIVGVAISIAIPLFNRNQGGVAEAHAALTRAQGEEAAFSLHVRQEVVSASARLVAATNSVSRLREKVLGSLQENLDLLQRSFEVGKLTSVELLTFRREFVESRRDYAEALAEAWRASIVVNLAAGRLPIPAASRED